MFRTIKEGALGQGRLQDVCPKWQRRLAAKGGSRVSARRGRVEMRGVGCEDDQK
jgi:hypothetical protein